MSLPGRDEGQMLLMASFIVAFGLVVIALMLSDILYVTVLASEASIDPVKYDFMNLQQLAHAEIKNAYKSSTTNDYTNWSIFETYNLNYIGNISKIYAGEGYAIKVQNGSPYEVRFTDNGLSSGSPNWKVVGNATNISTFKIYNYSIGNSFQIDVVNLTGIRLYSVNISTSITIINKTGDTSTINPPFPDPFDLLAIGGPFAFNTNTQGQTYSVHFNKGDQIAGRFNITGKSASNQTFIKARDYMINSTVELSSSRVRLNITIPVSVPW